MNQCLQAPGLVMDNIEKKTDVAVELAVKGIWEGNQQPITALGLKEGGMALTGLGDNVEELAVRHRGVSRTPSSRSRSCATRSSAERSSSLIR